MSDVVISKLFIFRSTNLILYKIFLFQFEEFNLTRAPWLTKIVFILFMILTPILLLNMLIAMMTTTIEEITKKAEKDWIHQKARIMILLEANLSAKDMIQFRKSYSTDIIHKSQKEKLSKPLEKGWEFNSDRDRDTGGVKSSEESIGSTCKPACKTNNENANFIDYGGIMVTITDSKGHK